MEITSLIPSSDNLYKFLLIGGIVSLIFSIVHPLEKKQQLEIELNNLLCEISNDSIRISKLNTEVIEFKSKSALVVKQLDSLSKDNNNKSLVDSLSLNYLMGLNDLRKRSSELVINNNKLKYDEKRIQLYNKHIDAFGLYSCAMLIIGITSLVYGFIHWRKVTKVAEEIQGIHLKNLTKHKEEKT